VVERGRASGDRLTSGRGGGIGRAAREKMLGQSLAQGSQRRRRQQQLSPKLEKKEPEGGPAAGEMAMCLR
jgi:hypothetical protein